MTSFDRIVRPGAGAGRMVLWGAIGGLLLLPAIAMCFTTQVAWDMADFAAAALLLVGGGLVFELGTRLTTDPLRRLAIGAAIMVVVATIWADAAVGIF